ncbi:MAG: hypothetical protein JOY92_12755 [Verrucomicrobia bacterium]|nr:hypothetical protein [Verrucomicrobiota bacterium]
MFLPSYTGSRFVLFLTRVGLPRFESLWSDGTLLLLQASPDELSLLEVHW